MLRSAHRWAGLATILVVAVLCASGFGLLVGHSFNLSGRIEIHTDTEQQAEYAGLDKALATISQTYPDYQAGMILASDTPNRAWQVSLRGKSGENAGLVVQLDPETGNLLSETVAGQSPKDWLLKLHNSLFLGLTGEVLILISAIALMFLSMTGILIVPGIWRHLRKGPLWNGVRSLHIWLGLVGAVFLLLWTVTGTALLAYKGFTDIKPARGRPQMAAAAPGSASPPVDDLPAANLSAILTSVSAAYPDREIQAVIPGRGARPVAVMMLNRSGPPWEKSTTFLFDAHSGEALPARDVPVFMRVMIAMKSLHTGVWDSPAVYAVYVIMGTVPIILIVTGPWLWIVNRRRRSKTPAVKGRSLKQRAQEC